MLSGDSQVWNFACVFERKENLSCSARYPSNSFLSVIYFFYNHGLLSDCVYFCVACYAMRKETNRLYFEEDKEKERKKEKLRRFFFTFIKWAIALCAIKLNKKRTIDESSRSVGGRNIYSETPFNHFVYFSQRLLFVNRADKCLFLHSNCKNKQSFIVKKKHLND